MSGRDNMTRSEWIGVVLCVLIGECLSLLLFIVGGATGLGAVGALSGGAMLTLIALLGLIATREDR